MSNDINPNMKNFEKMLDNIPDNVKELFMNLGKKDDSSSDSRNDSRNDSDIDSKTSNKDRYMDSFKSSDSMLNLESLMHIKKIFDKVDNGRDHKMELIRALQPFLRPSRQSKVLHCLKALRLSKICNEALSFSKNNTEKVRKDD